MRYKNIANQTRAAIQTSPMPRRRPSRPSSHNNGAIQNYGITQQVVLGELLSLDDFATETTYVRTNMMNIYTTGSASPTSTVFASIR